MTTEMTKKEVLSFFERNDRYIIVCHVNPDGDAIGSALGLAGVLEAMGKACKVACASPFPQPFSFLRKGLRLSMEKESENGGETIIAVDTASTGQWGALWQQYGRCDLSIDHHSSHENFSDLEYNDFSAASTTVIIHELATLAGITSPEIADAVFTGLTTDTGCFKYPNTDIRAHEVAIAAIRQGANVKMINKLMFETKSKSEMELWRMILNSIEYFCDGKIAIVTVTQAMRKKSGFSNDDLGELASIPRQIEGVIFGITIKQQNRSSCKISVRSNSGASSQRLAAMFGGGGHENAAGCTIKGSQKQVKQLLVEAAAAEIALTEQGSQNKEG